jgi:hypothetical protein
MMKLLIFLLNRFMKGREKRIRKEEVAVEVKIKKI